MFVFQSGKVPLLLLSCLNLIGRDTMLIQCRLSPAIWRKLQMVRRNMASCWEAQEGLTKQSDVSRQASVDVWE